MQRMRDRCLRCYLKAPIVSAVYVPDNLSATFKEAVGEARGGGRNSEISHFFRN